MSERPTPAKASGPTTPATNPDAWVKIDLSQLDQTGLNQAGKTTDIYMLGYAASSGQILQKESGKIVFATPQPSALVLPADQFQASGKQVSLTTSANLIVGGAVTFGNGTTTTITGISANVVCANQPVGNGAFAPYTDPNWQTGADVVVLGPASINQGSVADAGQGAQISQIPSAAGIASGVGVGALLSGYFPPQGGMPSAQAVVANGVVTGWSNLQNNGGRYQTAPTVTFPGSGVTKVAEGTCVLDANGYVSGVTITVQGQGYEAGTTYAAVFSNAPGNTYFFPVDADGFPGGANATDATSVTAVGQAGGSMTLTVSQAVSEPGWAPQPPIQLGAPAVFVYAGGTNASGYGTLKSFSTTTDLTTSNAVIGDLPATGAVQGFNLTADSAGSSLMVRGAAGTVMIYAVLSYTVTLADAVPAGTRLLTFGNSVAATADAAGTALTLPLSSYPGIGAALALGQNPIVSYQQTQAGDLTITALGLSAGTLTITLSGPLPAAFQGKAVTLQLPPTGGLLPVFTWDAATDNAVWAQQLPGPAGSLSVNGARIYFVLDTLGLGKPAFNYQVGVDAAGNQVVTVTQPPDALVWEGRVSPFQYVELTADAMSPGDGKVYIDLSAVDGFFYPAALSATVDKQTLMVGQPWQAYTGPNTTGPNTYAAVTRTAILDAWAAFFTTANFPNAAALQQAYAGLQVAAGTGIQNPTFSYTSPNTAISAFETCWDKALDALFQGTDTLDLTGDLPIGGQPAYYQGTQVSVGAYRALKFTEYAGAYTSPTGAVFWVFDPRTPPPSEGQAFVQSGVAMSVGYQVFANTGVFASTAVVLGGTTPNYLAGSSAWSTPDALKQLLSLQRDMVTALNRGMGAKGLGIGTAGATTTYWNTETNWYPYAAPFEAATPQNLFSQWVHTAVIDAANHVYYATYPFGGGHGNPTQSAVAKAPGTGPYMNQTYGFGYDETPNNGANVPTKFLPITNQAGNTLSFQLVFGPWN